MAKKDKDEEVIPKWSPSRQEVEDLRTKLKSYKQISINGRLQRRIDQYMESLGVISFDRYGSIVVRKYHDYRVALATYDKLHAIEYREQMAYLEKHPEEKIDYKALRPINFVKKMQ